MGSGSGVHRTRGAAYVPLMSMTSRVGASMRTAWYLGCPVVDSVTVTPAGRCSTLTFFSCRGRPGASAARAGPMPAQHRVIRIRNPAMCLTVIGGSPSVRGLRVCSKSERQGRRLLDLGGPARDREGDRVRGDVGDATVA